MLELGDRSINVMVLAGLVVAIGVVVDDAIIDVENIVRRLRQAREGDSKASTFRVVLDASVEVRSAITYATVINVVAIVPVFFLQGLSGSFFQPLVLSYGLAVLASMLVALTVTPALCLLMLSRGHLRRGDSPLLRVLKRGYTAVLARIIRRPSPSIVAAGGALLAGLLIYPTLGSQLLPNFKERDFLMHWLTEPATSASEEKRISIRACRDLREVPGVRNCGSHIGQALLSDEIYGVYFGENWISVDEDVDYDQTLDAVHRTVEGYPGLYRDVQTYLRERIKEVLTGTSESIVVRIFGPDLTVLREEGRRDREADRRGGWGDRRARGLRRGPAARGGRAGPRCGHADTGSSPGTCGASRRPSSRARRSATSSSPGRPTTSTSGACPPRVTASPTSSGSR